MSGSAPSLKASLDVVAVAQRGNNGEAEWRQLEVLSNDMIKVAVEERRPIHTD